MIVGEARRALLALALVAMLTSCSDSAPTGPTTPTASRTTVAPTTSPTLSSPLLSPSPSPTLSVAKPVLPNAAKQPNREGAAAFYKYFWATYNYAFVSLDVGPLVAASEPGCKYCSSTATAISKAIEQGFKFRGGGVSVIASVAAPGEPRSGLLVNGAVEQAAGETLRPNGSVAASDSAFPRRRADAIIRWNGKEWRVAEVRVISE